MFHQAAQELVLAARAQIVNDALQAGVRSIYRYADAAIATRRPTCHQCARCCQFDQYGHNLFVSTAEVAVFLRSTSLVRISGLIEGACPFLRTDPARCAARFARPLGCRLYYCDKAASVWQQDLYRLLHRRLQDLHQALDVPYHYAEWLTVLRAAALCQQP